MDAITGYMIGNYNNILKTTNTGSNWNQFMSFPFSISSTTFLNNTTGFAVGGREYGIDSLGMICRTINGGSTWDTAYKDHRGMIMM
jgi:photosystem II stability/assembly factor-like uncharacterized protein